MYIKAIFPAMLLATLASPTLAWTISADFDSGAIGTTADKGGDGFSGAGGKSTYTDEQALSGQAAKLTIEKGQTGYGTWGGEFRFPNRVGSGETIWFQVYTYFPEGFDHYAYAEGYRLKFLRIQTLSSSGSNHGYIDFYIDRQDDPNPFKWIYEGRQQWVNVGEPEDLIVKGQWESYQMRVTLGATPVASGGEAEIFIWKNGNLLSHITNQKTLISDTDYAPRALLFTYWNGGSPQTQSMYVDDVTITTDAPNFRDANGIRMLPSVIPNPPAPIESLSVD